MGLGFEVLELIRGLGPVGFTVFSINQGLGFRNSGFRVGLGLGFGVLELIRV